MTESAVAHGVESFVIEGGRRLSGRVRAAGNKNATLPILAACVLTSEPVELTNVPRIRDVKTMLALLSEIGADVDWTGPNELRISCANAGRLLSRLGRALVPPPGGDPIGRRRLDVHVHALAELGAEITVDGGFDMRAGELTGKGMFLDEHSVTGTENAVM